MLSAALAPLESAIIAEIFLDAFLNICDACGMRALLLEFFKLNREISEYVFERLGRILDCAAPRTRFYPLKRQ